MSLEDCLAAAQDCDAPMVSICGGEPLIYPKIEELIEGLLKQDRIIYICTNGVFHAAQVKGIPGQRLFAVQRTAVDEPHLRGVDLDQRSR